MMHTQHTRVAFKILNRSLVGWLVGACVQLGFLLEIICICEALASNTLWITFYQYDIIGEKE